jgi:hypothetical protein
VSITLLGDDGALKNPSPLKKSSSAFGGFAPQASGCTVKGISKVIPGKSSTGCEISIGAALIVSDEIIAKNANDS